MTLEEINAMNLQNGDMIEIVFHSKNRTIKYYRDLIGCSIITVSTFFEGDEFDYFDNTFYYLPDDIESIKKLYRIEKNMTMADFLLITGREAMQALSKIAKQEITRIYDELKNQDTDNA